jgi:hypothetical protein
VTGIGQRTRKKNKEAEKVTRVDIKEATKFWELKSK